MKKSTLLTAAISAATLCIALTAQAAPGSSTTQHFSNKGCGSGKMMFEVEVVNLTPGQQFTPLLVATHSPSISFFTRGQPASAGLATLAEEGNVMPLAEALTATGKVTDADVGTGLTDPGKTVKFMVDGDPSRDKLSLASMLIPTNDAFVALSNASLPKTCGKTVSYNINAYDAGSEANDELCASIPGPNFAECNGPGGGASPAGGEGFVHIHNGVHGVGDLKPTRRDWNNPVARVMIKAVPMR